MKTKDFVQISLFAAILCILAPLSIPLAGGIPISLSNFAVLLAGVLLGKKKGLLATLLYIFLGIVGLPVFSSYQSGLSVLFGMTGGFIIGYIPLAYISGYFSDTYQDVIKIFLGILIAEIIQYTIGILWFQLLTQLP
mgnify:FL=1